MLAQLGAFPEWALIRLQEPPKQVAYPLLQLEMEAKRRSFRSGIAGSRENPS